MKTCNITKLVFLFLIATSPLAATSRAQDANSASNVAAYDVSGIVEAVKAIRKIDNSATLDVTEAIRARIPENSDRKQVLKDLAKQGFKIRKHDQDRSEASHQNHETYIATIKLNSTMLRAKMFVHVSYDELRVIVGFFDDAVKHVNASLFHRTL